MKKMVLSAVVFALCTTQAFAIIGNIGSSSAVDYAGTVRPETVEKLYINVKNTKGSTVAAGSVMTIDVSNDDGASATTLSTGGLSPLCIVVSACSANALCLCQRYGLFSAALFDSTANNAVAGSRWYMSSANAGYVSARGTSLATEVPGGIFYDAASASGSVEIFINL